MLESIIESIVPAIIGAGATYVFVYRYNKKRTYIEYVTKERISWMNELRKNVATLNSIISITLLSEKFTKKNDEDIFYYISLIKLSLNPGEKAKEEREIENNLVKLEEKIFDLDFDEKNYILIEKELKDILKELNKKFSKIFKENWEVIKTETKTNKISKKNK